MVATLRLRLLAETGVPHRGGSSCLHCSPVVAGRWMLWYTRGDAKWLFYGLLILPEWPVALEAESIAPLTLWFTNEVCLCVQCPLMAAVPGTWVVYWSTGPLSLAAVPGTRVVYWSTGPLSLAAVSCSQSVIVAITSTSRFIVWRSGPILCSFCSQSTDI